MIEMNIHMYMCIYTTIVHVHTWLYDVLNCKIDLGWEAITVHLQVQWLTKPPSTYKHMIYKVHQYWNRIQ